MKKKLTITVDEKVYKGLHSVIGRRRVSRFLEDLARPHVIRENLDTEYRDMAADEEREKEALEWSEGLIEDLKDETR
jgi:predicted CopG family antitoxin